MPTGQVLEHIFPQVQAGQEFVMVPYIQVNGHPEEPMEEQMEEPRASVETEEPNQPEK